MAGKIVTGRAEIEAILAQCKVCRLGMIAEGKPYIVPLNFGYEWDGDALILYFHSGLTGKKLDAMRENPAVYFEMDCEGGLTGTGDTACRYSYAFQSLAGDGIAGFAAAPDEKRHGFDCIMRHQTGRDGWTYTDKQLSAAAVFHVRAEQFTAMQKVPRG